MTAHACVQMPDWEIFVVCGWFTWLHLKRLTYGRFRMSKFIAQWPSAIVMRGDKGGIRANFKRQNPVWCPDKILFAAKAWKNWLIGMQIFNLSWWHVFQTRVSSQLDDGYHVNGHFLYLSRLWRKFFFAYRDTNLSDTAFSDKSFIVANG